MHILLYYVCHALQFTEIALKCKMLKGKEMKLIILTLGHDFYISWFTKPPTLIFGKWEKK